MSNNEPPLKKCAAESEDVCRHLVCPRHRRRLAYCPWEKNGKATGAKGVVPPEQFEHPTEKHRFHLEPGYLAEAEAAGHRENAYFFLDPDFQAMVEDVARENAIEREERLRN